MRHDRTLRALELIVRLGSIRKAAARLNIESSALNRQLLELERELGTPLFERLARGVRLTAAGELFIAYARRSILELERVRSEIEALRGLSSGTIAIAVIEAVAGTMLPRAIAAFHRRYPRITFDVQVLGASEVVRRVTSDACEIGVTLGTIDEPAFQAYGERPQALHAIIAAGHPLAGRDRLRLADCEPFPILLGDASLGGRMLLDRVLTRASAALRPVLVSNSIQLMTALVATTDAICFQITIGAEDMAARGLSAVPLSDAGLRDVRLVLGTRRGRLLPPAAAAFCEQLSADLVAGTGP